MALASTAPIQPLDRHSFPVKSIWVLVVVQIAFGVLGAMTTWAVAFAPLRALIGCIAGLWPRAGVYLLTVSIFLRVDIPGVIGIYPGDIISLLLVAGLVIHVTLNGSGQLRKHPLLITMAEILVAFAASMIWAFDPSVAIVNWFRHLQMFLIILVVAEVCHAQDIWRILWLVLSMGVAFSIPNIVRAIQIDGSQRVFGVASAFFPFYLATAIMFCCIGYLLYEEAWKRRLLAILALPMGLGIIVTQTREAMLYAAIGVLLSCGIIWWWAGRMRLPSIQRRVLWLVLGSTLAVIIFLSGAISTFEMPANRVFQAVEGRSNTIFIRLFLWKTGLQVFLDSPIMGIGLAQIGKWDQFVSFWRFDPMSQFSRGLGAHNDLVTYAAETGLIGLAALFWFFVRVTRVGWRTLPRIADRSSLHLLLSVWVPCLAIFARFFYGTHTFYSLGGLFNCLYFGLLIACVRQSSAPQTGLVGQSVA